MTKKQTKPKQYKLPLTDQLAAVDLRNFNFYDNLSPELAKEFNPFILMRYISSVQGDRETQEWFLEKTNEFVNKNYSSFNKDDRSLMWKLYASIGAGVKVFHPYIPLLKVELNKIEKLIAELYPTMKTEDIKLLSSLMAEEDKEDLFDKMGFDKEQRKAYK